MENVLSKDNGGVGVALLMIDFQCDFCLSGGYAAQAAGTAWVAPIIPAAQRLLFHARDKGWLVVHTREGYAPDLSDLDAGKLTKSKKFGAPIGDEGPLGRFLIRGENGHTILPELAPLAREMVFDKPSYGAFFGTHIEEVLVDNRITDLVFAGVTADICVHTTLREAVERGFNCWYVRDAISTFDSEIRRACEKMVEAEGGVWGTVTEVDWIRNNEEFPVVCS